MSKKSRNFCFTVNNWTQEHLDFLAEVECKYIIYGKEVAPTTMTPHLQGFVVFSNPRALSGVLTQMRTLGGHWEIAKGSPGQNIDYCSKAGDVTERGTRSGQIICHEQDSWQDAQGDRFLTVIHPLLSQAQYAGGEGTEGEGEDRMHVEPSQEWSVRATPSGEYQDMGVHPCEVLGEAERPSSPQQYLDSWSERMWQELLGTQPVRDVLFEADE